MMNLDSIFGYCETTKTENIFWDREVTDHLKTWTTKDSRESFGNINISNDFELNMRDIFEDPKQTISFQSIINDSVNYLYLDTDFEAE